MDEVARFFSGSVPASLMKSHAFPPVAPALVVLKHKAHSEEKISKNGLQRTVHIVVKNSPFYLTLGLSPGSSNKVDLNQVAFEPTLMYDCEGSKEVDYVRVKPYEFKAVPNETGNEVEVELRIKVLTSQHEDMLFKVKIQGQNPMTKEDIPGLSVITSPIKVISKPEQLKKKNKESKKRSLTDMLVETVQRIEKKQEEQQQLISKLMTQQSEILVQDSHKKQKVDELMGWELNEMLPSEQREQITDLVCEETQEGCEVKGKSIPDFEDAFANLIRAYNQMSPEEKPEIIRKLIRNSSTRDTERLSELLDLFWTEGLQKELGGRSSSRDRISTTMMNEDGCNCLECPHKQELERIDEFYKEFLSTGVNSSVLGVSGY